ncbi:DUF1273 domain-containing protein [Caldifermentibacillus hisashii]|uniref:DUF1273 domain-containing protein n=1 Tax=Caldifermentibacillus hisashii TaxID=996558 RepID=UPI0030D66393|nr:DUF1273 domain-containing protein [Caldibacillus thermoamylovorans]
MMKRLVITGYKPHELGIFHSNHPGIPYIKKAIKKQLIPLLEEGLEWVLLSGQLGVETWAAEVIMDLQCEYPKLKYAVITPFLDQEKNWKEEKQEKYEEILLNADFHSTVTKKPYEGPWQFVAKNKFFIRNSDGLLLVYDDEKVGSPQYILKMAKIYAETHDYQLLVINSDDLQALIDEEMYNG